MVIGTAIF